MPKATRGGRRSPWVRTPAPTTPNPPAPNPPAPSGPVNYGNLTDSEAAQLRQQQDSMYNGTVTAAVKMYISGQPGTPAANVDGQGHSLSQSMNYLLEQGVDLNSATAPALNRQFGINLSPRALASMQYTNNIMDQGSHAIGKNIVLTRGAHDDVLKNEFGLKNYQNLTESQLKQKLVGGTFTSKAYMSTSYDSKKSPFLGNNPQAGGREVVYRINAGANTKILFGNKAQSEIIISKGTKFRIKDVSYTGRVATPRMGGAKNQIVIDLETY